MRPLTFFLLATALSLNAQVINTVGGSSAWSFVTDVAVDPNGRLFGSDAEAHRVYRLDPDGSYVTVAGTGSPGFTGDGGAATAATLRTPRGITFDAAGNLYICDHGNGVVRRVAPNGVITTVAGNGSVLFTGDGGPATSAGVQPWDIAADRNGDLLIVDSWNYRIRRLRAGVLSTIAGNGNSARAGDGGPALLAGMLPTSVTAAADGSLYFTDGGRDAPTVRRISPTGQVTTIAGTGRGGFAGDGGLATQAQFASVDGIAVDGTGNVYVAEYWGDRVRRISPDGIIITFAGGRSGAGGDGGPAAAAGLNAPAGLAIDSEGALLIADTYNKKVRRVASPPRPTISSTNAAVPAFLGAAGFTSGSYLEIYGTNLSASTRTWAGVDFNGRTAPTTLDGVSVTVNGRPAFIYFISPTQININAPDDTATGPVAIQVTTPAGASNIGMVTRSRVAPTLHGSPAFNSGNKRYVVAQASDFRAFAGPAGLVAGLNFYAPKPGDTVIIYALGCGPTNPATAAGTIAAQNAPLTLPHQVRIGGQDARVTFAGAVAGSVALYQLNIVIPNLTPGEHSIEFTIDGVANQQNLLLVTGN